jgi:AcrR family transcriptional regulator
MVRQAKFEEKDTGRELQKNRTRKALVAAASDLLRRGQNPRVADVAEAAGISRATAYRYFPTQELLLVEVALFAVGGPTFPAAQQDKSVPEAVGRLVRRAGTWAYAREQPLRTILRLSLDPSTGVRRPRHRVDWIADVLAPARGTMDSETFNKLSKSLTLLLGIDPVVVMKDIAGATREQALNVLEWTAKTLVEAALGSRVAVGGRKDAHSTPLI